MTIDDLRSNTGEEVAVSDWTTVSQDMIDRFADLTGDRQWIHIDPERARRESPYGAAFAHGFLTLSLLSSLSRQALEIEGDFRMRVNYGLNRARFPAPVRAGDRVRGHFAPHSVEDVPGAVEIVWAVTVEVEGSAKPALFAEWVTRLYRREAAC